MAFRDMAISSYFYIHLHSRPQERLALTKFSWAAVSQVVETRSADRKLLHLILFAVSPTAWILILGKL